MLNGYVCACVYGHNIIIYMYMNTFTRLIFFEAWAHQEKAKDQSYREVRRNVFSLTLACVLVCGSPLKAHRHW